VRRVLALVAVAACCGCGAAKTHSSAPTAPKQSSSVGFAIEPPVAAPSFRLRDEQGRPIGPQDERGHLLVVTFLYTRCPDVCPLITNNLVAAQRQNPDLRVIAVSVDPAHDTQAAVRRFLREHHAGSRFHYVYGSRAALQPVWAKYHIAALPGPKGTVSHSAFSVLVDRGGKERRLFDSSVTSAQVLKAAGEL
jgi:protein SCO1/2